MKLNINRPTTDQLIKIAILFNRGNSDAETITKMTAMSEFVLDRLQENNDIEVPTKKEVEENPYLKKAYTQN